MTSVEETAGLRNACPAHGKNLQIKNKRQGPQQDFVYFQRRLHEVFGGENFYLVETAWQETISVHLRSGVASEIFGLGGWLLRRGGYNTISVVI